MKTKKLLLKKPMLVLLTVAILMAQVSPIWALGSNTKTDTKISYGEYITELVKVFHAESQIPEVKNRKHKADKYIAKAHQMEIFEYGELVSDKKGYGFKERKDYPDSTEKTMRMDEPITKQDVIRYACKALNIQLEKNVCDIKVFEDWC